MTSLVLELHHEAMDPNIRVDDLLRKAVVVATKLGVDDFRAWAAKELQGYAGDPTTPAYREVIGVLKVHSPSRGWTRVILPDKDLQKRLESRAAAEPIGELEDLWHDPDRGNTLEMGAGVDAGKVSLEDLMDLVPMPPDWLLRVFGDTREFQVGMVPTFFIRRLTILGILDAVRSEVLRWSLALEGQGILGEE